MTICAKFDGRKISDCTRGETNCPCLAEKRRYDEGMRILRELATALDAAFISSWQSTAEWQKQLDAALEYLKQELIQ